MLLMKDPKKFATLILAKKSPDYSDLKKANESGEGYKIEASVEKEGAEQDSKVGYEAAAQGILEAIDSKDSKALMSALKDFVTLCSSEMPEEE